MADITKDKIIAAARELFAKNGVRDVSIDDICRKLCISKKTFYQNYSQKEDLVADIVTIRFEEKKMQFEKLADGKNTVELLHHVFRIIGKKKTMAFGVEKRITMEIEKYYPETFDRNRAERTKAIRDYFMDGFARGMEEGYIRKDMEVEGTLLIMCLMHRGMVDYLYGDVPFGDRKLPFKSILAAFEGMIVRALLTERGMREYRDIQKAKIKSYDKII